MPRSRVARAIPRLISLLVATRGLCGHLIGAQPATAADPRAALLVTPAWLAQHLHDPDLVLLHVGDRAEYDKGHIPGARYVGMRDVSVSSDDHEKGLMLELPTADTLRARLEALGISDRSRIVVYYGSDWVSRRRALSSRSTTRGSAHARRCSTAACPRGLPPATPSRPTHRRAPSPQGTSRRCTRSPSSSTRRG